jgi:hypothetical protein
VFLYLVFPSEHTDLSYSIRRGISSGYIGGEFCFLNIFQYEHAGSEATWSSIFIREPIWEPIEALRIACGSIGIF